MKKITYTLLLSALTSSFLWAQDLAQVEYDMKFEKYDTAKESLYKLMRKEPKPKEGKYYYNIGVIHIEQGFPDSAMIYLKKGLLAVKDIDINNIAIGRIALDEGKEKEANSKFNASLYKAKPGEIDFLLLIAKNYIESDNQDTEKAIEFAKKALEQQPNSIDARLVLADAYFAEKSIRRAWATLLEIKRLEEKNVPMLHSMAKIHKYNNEFPEAIEKLELAIQENENFEPAYQLLGEVYLDYSRFSGDKSKRKDGVKYYAKYHDMIGKSYDADNQYAQFLVRSFDFETLQEFTDKNWLQRGNNFPLYKFRGIAEFELGNREEAFQHLWQYFDVQDKTKLRGVDLLYYGLSEVEKSKNADGTYNEEMYNKAIDNIAQGVSKDPELAEELYQYGLELFNEEKFMQSYFLFDIGTRNPNNRNLVYDSYYKGTTLYMLSDEPMFKNQRQKAIDAFDLAIEASPTSHESYLQKARTLVMMKGATIEADAEKTYEKYIDIVENKNLMNVPQLKNGVVEGALYIANYNKDKNQAKAKRYYQKVLNLQPDNHAVKKSLNSLN